MDDQPKSGNENQAKSVAPIVITTIITTLVVVGIMWLIFSSSSSPSTQQQSVASNNEVNPNTQTQQAAQAAPQQPVPTQNTAPVVQQPRYYTPMTFSPTAEAQRASGVLADKMIGTFKTF
jgi:flagellar basal body-associated protein FliL